MPEKLYIPLAIGVVMLFFFIYELVTQKAYGVWKKGRAKELNSRWHTRTDDPQMYWKLILTHGILSTLIIAYIIRELL